MFNIEAHLRDSDNRLERKVYVLITIVCLNSVPGQSPSLCKIFSFSRTVEPILIKLDTKHN